MFDKIDKVLSQWIIEKIETGRISYYLLPILILFYPMILVFPTLSILLMPLFLYMLFVLVRKNREEQVVVEKEKNEADTVLDSFETMFVRQYKRGYNDGIKRALRSYEKGKI